MKYLQKFESFTILNETTNKPAYSYDLFKLLSNVFIFDLKKWIDKNTYFQFSESTLQFDPSISFGGLPYLLTDEEFLEVMVKKIDSFFKNIKSEEIIKSKSPSFTREVPLILPRTRVSEIRIYLKNNDNEIHYQKDHDIFSMRIWNGREGNKICVPHRTDSSQFFWKSPEFDSLVQNWTNDNSSDYYFGEEFIMQCGLNFKKSIVRFWTIYLSKMYDIKYINLISDLNFNKVNEPFTVLMQSISINNDFLSDILNEYKKKKKFLPSAVALYFILVGCDIEIPASLFSEEILDIVESSPEILDQCRKNLPDIYQLIKSKREEDQRWKTDLSAEMGNLGFD